MPKTRKVTDPSSATACFRSLSRDRCRQSTCYIPDQFQHYPPTGAWASKVVSSLQASRPKRCMALLFLRPWF